MGHLFRAINLHRTLRAKGFDSVIALLDGDDASKNWLKKAAIPYAIVNNSKEGGWEASLIAKFSPKVWVNDRLNTDLNHARILKMAGLWLATFDDAGTGANIADLHVAALANVRGDFPVGRVSLIGPDYLVSSPEIMQLRKMRTKIERLIVTLGGSDTHGATISVIKLLNAHCRSATIVLGPSFAHERELSSLNSNNLIIKRAVPSLLKELAAHDLAITGGGLTAFEAAMLGIPTLVVANEPWEILHAKYLESLGCSIFVGTHYEINLDILDKGIDIECMSRSALNAFFYDGANKVGEALINLLLRKE